MEGIFLQQITGWRGWSRNPAFLYCLAEKWLHWQTVQHFSVFQSASTASHWLLLLVGFSSERTLNITSQH